MNNLLGMCYILCRFDLPLSGEGLGAGPQMKGTSGGPNPPNGEHGVSRPPREIFWVVFGSFSGHGFLIPVLELGF